MNAAEYRRRQRKRRALTVLLISIAGLIFLVLVFFLLWGMNRDAYASIPPPGTITPPPDNYPNVEAHAVTMAGYDLSSDGRPYILLSDPADNANAGESHNFTSNPTRLPLLNDGRRWYVDYPGESIGCIYYTLVIRESSPEARELPDNWLQADLPDLSQNAIKEWGDTYCAPTAAANVAWMLGKRHSTLDPAIIFGLPENANPSLRANMLVGGEEEPIPNPKSLAGLMNTKKDNGTEIDGFMNGLRNYLSENDSVLWTLNDPKFLQPMPLLDIIKNESARGSGIVFLLRWGNPEVEAETNDSSILFLLERDAEKPESQESGTSTQEQTNSPPPFTFVAEDNKTVGINPDITELIRDKGSEPSSGTNDLGQLNKEIKERLKDVKAGSGDIQLSLTWDNYNDLDLSCTEPDGTVISFENRRSPSGGNMDLDMNSAPQSNQPVENIFWPLGQARSGKYRIYVDYYRRHTSSNEEVEFTLRVIVGEKEQFLRAKLPPKSGRTLVHTFEYK